MVTLNYQGELASLVTDEVGAVNVCMKGKKIIYMVLGLILSQIGTGCSQ
jgi:hypothetical protein